MDLIGIEPMTSSMPWKRAPSCATGPQGRNNSLIVVANGWQVKRGGGAKKRRRYARQPASSEGTSWCLYIRKNSRWPRRSGLLGWPDGHIARPGPSTLRRLHPLWFAREHAAGIEVHVVVHAAVGDVLPVTLMSGATALPITLPRPVMKRTICAPAQIRSMMPSVSLGLV